MRPPTSLSTLSLSTLTLAHTAERQLHCENKQRASKPDTISVSHDFLDEEASCLPAPELTSTTYTTPGSPGSQLREKQAPCGIGPGGDTAARSAGWLEVIRRKTRGKRL